MNPVAFPEANEALLRPPSMSRQECKALAVCRAQTWNGISVVISCWKPTADELEEIQRTGQVWLVLVGDTMPPAAVLGLPPAELKSVLVEA